MGKSNFIFDFLKSKGIKTYYPANKFGECKEEYVVIKGAGSSQYNTLSTKADIYDIMCYVPQNKFSILEDYVENIEKYMQELEPTILPTYSKTAPFYDDSLKAHMVSVQYINYRKIERGVLNGSN